MSKETAGAKPRPDLESSLAELVKKLDASKSTRQGSIVFNALGEGGGTYHVRSGAGKAGVEPLARSADAPTPLIEMTGDAKTIRAVLSGEKDALTTFFAGGFRVRGDLRYVSDLALELGLIDKPL